MLSIEIGIAVDMRRDEGIHPVAVRDGKHVPGIGHHFEFRPRHRRAQEPADAAQRQPGRPALHDERGQAELAHVVEPTSVRLRTRSGRVRAICRATAPP